VFRESLRFDLLVAGCLLVELKAVQDMLPVHKAQLLSYMRLLNVPLGLLFNFHETKLADGISRLLLQALNRSKRRQQRARDLIEAVSAQSTRSRNRRARVRHGASAAQQQWLQTMSCASGVGALKRTKRPRYFLATLQPRVTHQRCEQAPNPLLVELRSVTLRHGIRASVTRLGGVPATGGVWRVGAGRLG
jgi:hypothetical protein